MENKRHDYLSDFFHTAPSIWLRCKGWPHVGQVEVAELVKRCTMNTPVRAAEAVQVRRVRSASLTGFRAAGINDEIQRGRAMWNE